MRGNKLQTYFYEASATNRWTVMDGSGMVDVDGCGLWWLPIRRK